MTTTPLKPEQTITLPLALAVALRDKYLADARQAMKLVREIERQYGLAPTKKERS